MRGTRRIEHVSDEVSLKMRRSAACIIYDRMRRWKSLVPVAFALSLLIPAQFSRTPAAAATRWCSLEVAGIALMPDAKTYAIELSSDDGTPVDARLQFYSDGAEYGATLTGIAFSRTSPAESTALKTPARFISAPAYVTLPKLDFLTAVRAVLADNAAQTAKSCSSHFGYTDFYQRQAIGGYQPTDAWSAWRQQRVDALARGPAIVAATVTSDTAPSCDHPNAVVGVTNMVQPMYPKLAREQGISGTATIRVDVDEKGGVTNAYVFKSAGDNSLDVAALNAARQSKYSPETFRCLPLPATYDFVMSFGAPQNNTSKQN